MEELVNLGEVSKRLGGISIWTLRKHISRGSIHVTRIGRRVFLDADELERIRRDGLPSLRNELSTVREEEPCPGK